MARSTLGPGQPGSLHGHAVPGLPHLRMLRTSATVGAGLRAGAGQAQLLAASTLAAHAMALGLASTANAAISFFELSCPPWAPACTRGGRGPIQPLRSLVLLRHGPAPFPPPTPFYRLD